MSSLRLPACLLLVECAGSYVNVKLKECCGALAASCGCFVFLCGPSTPTEYTLATSNYKHECALSQSLTTATVPAIVG